MNSTATSGKNLQTVFPLPDPKGAYEISLLSPAAPDLSHHPLFSSLAQRQRTPVPGPSTTPVSTSRNARNYGPRRLRYRWAEQLKPWQVAMLHEADAVASAMGLPLNTFATVNYHGTFPGGAAMASTFKRGLKLMCQWLRDNNTPAAYVYVHENPGDEKPNSHLLVHVPAQLLRAFTERAAAWFQALDGGVLVEARNDRQRHAKGLYTRLQYMAKGADYLTCRRYDGYRAKGGQGPISIKRAGVAQLLRSKPDFSGTIKPGQPVFRNHYARAREGAA